MFVFEIEAGDVYSALGRVLDRTRVAGLRISAVTADEKDGGYAISTTVDTADRDIVERLARQFRGVVGITSVTVERETISRPSNSAFPVLTSSVQTAAASA